MLPVPEGAVLIGDLPSRCEDPGPGAQVKCPRGGGRAALSQVEHSLETLSPRAEGLAPEQVGLLVLAARPFPARVNPTKSELATRSACSERRLLCTFAVWVCLSAGNLMKRLFFPKQ